MELSCRFKSLLIRDVIFDCILRHYFITQKVNANMPLVSIAEMCGTSISQIEKTYYHTTLDKMVLNALGG